MLTSEQSHPEYERDENAKTRIDQRWWPYIRMKPRPNKEPPSEQSRANPDQSAEHPGRKKRADNIDLWSHLRPLVSKHYLELSAQTAQSLPTAMK